MKLRIPNQTYYIFITTGKQIFLFAAVNITLDE